MGAGAKAEGTGIGRRVAAFGEVRTVAEWAADARARVWAEAILARLDEGMPPEEAIARPPARPKGQNGLILAFGERKSLRDWADDYRAATSMQNIGTRLRAGWRPEDAIATAAAAHSMEKVEAFGEAKSLQAWARDPRAGASREMIRRRLLEGVAPEEAITAPTRDARTAPLAAFGETKSLAAWARDPRCRVSEGSLAKRLESGLAPEAAITRANPHAERLAEGGERIAGLPGHARLVTAFGETKSVNAWAKDPRCPVDTTTLRNRLLGGVPPEAAIVAPPTNAPATLSAYGETKSVGEWARDPRCAVSAICLYQRASKGMDGEAALSTPTARGWESRVLAAFGEAKTLREWAADARCRVPYRTLHDRVAKHKMALELALAAPTAVCKRGAYGEMAEAFGERKLLGEWMRDARCAVARKTLGYRLRAGWALEEALTTPERGKPPTLVQGTFLEAFGERKNVRQWSLDERCVVGLATLEGRLKRGWDLERAMTTSPLGADYGKGVPRPKGPRWSVEAFGETRLVAEWARDPRCAVRLSMLHARLKAGWSAEEAIALPSGAKPYARKAKLRTAA